MLESMEESCSQLQREVHTPSQDKAEVIIALILECLFFKADLHHIITHFATAEERIQMAWSINIDNMLPGSWFSLSYGWNLINSIRSIPHYWTYARDLQQRY